MAKLYFRFGTMNSGKSSDLIRTAYNYDEINSNAVIVKPGIDSKGGGNVVGRDGSSRKVDIVAPESMDLYESILEWQDQSRQINCILTDESQFFTTRQVDQLFKLVVIENIATIAYGLRTDFTGHLFEGSKRLMELAHSIEELKTMCTCGQRKATMNARKINGNYIFTGDTVAIDGVDLVTYDALCGQCYLENKEKDESIN